MSAIDVLKAARAAGVELSLDGDDLVLEAFTPPPQPILDQLTRHKPDIVALLRPGPTGVSAEDTLDFFEERAAILQFDMGLSRDEAERVARALVYSRVLN